MRNVWRPLDLLMAKPPTAEEIWRAELTGQSRTMSRNRSLFKLLPSDPRCKQCNAPFRGIGGVISGLLGRQSSKKNPRICNYCETLARTYHGGAEVELTLLFVDVRGSTALAEQMTASEFSRLMNRFYDVAIRVLIESDAMIDKLVGDEVIGLYFPFLTDHAARAVRAARSLMRATGVGDPAGPWIPTGVGIHTGVAYVGAVGSDETSWDFTALGDTVNTAARLVAAAAAGEILLSDATYEKAGLDDVALERRELVLKGKSEPVGVRVLRIATA
jgi:adenylate cyclase